MKTAEELLSLYKVPFRYPVSEPSRLHQPPTWDGAVLTLDWIPSQFVYNDGSRGRREWAIHEISHWLLATPEARAVPNYGLGTDPGGGGPSDEDRSVLEGLKPSDIEELALIVDVVIMRRHRLPAAEVQYHIKNYGINTITDLRLVVMDRVRLVRARCTDKQIEDALKVIRRTNETDPWL
jgi:hypothetical protein